jgi:hypothetical protein
LDTDAGTSWRLIFKDECYRPELIAALEGLPVSPGPPEAILYRNRNTALSAFLPQLFWFREVEPGRHFQYLLEDLAPTHALLRPDTGDHIKATRGLLHIHKALREAFAAEYPYGLIRYDRRYSERLLDYALGNLAEYGARTADGAVAALSGRWREIASVHQRDEFYDDDLRVPIHGDYNSSNIHAHREDANQLKVVDWEWAGVGLPHADLAALGQVGTPRGSPGASASLSRGRPTARPRAASAPVPVVPAGTPLARCRLFGQAAAGLRTTRILAAGGDQAFSR